MARDNLVVMPAGITSENYIELLKDKIKDKETIIATKDAVIDGKDAIIKLLTAKIAEMHTKI